jgi:hypothetical protein
MNTQARIRRWSSLTLITLVVAPLIAFATVNNATLTIGRLTVPIGGVTLVFSGYSNGSYGSYSPTGLGGGKTVITVYDLTSNGSIVNSTLRITGFTSNPGVSYLNSATCNGVIVNGGHATRTYDSGTGTVTYSWAPPEPQFGLSSLSVGTNVSCSIDHN